MILRLTHAEFQPGDRVHGRVVQSVDPPHRVHGWIGVWMTDTYCSTLPNVPFDVERPERMAEFSVEDVRAMVRNDGWSEGEGTAFDRLRARLAELDAEAQT